MPKPDLKRAVTEETVRRRRTRRRIVIAVLAPAAAAAAFWWFDPLTDPNIKLIRERTALFEEMTAIVDTVTDRPSAEAAAEKLRSFAARESALQLRAKQLQPPSELAVRRMKSYYSPRLNEAEKQFTERLNALPKSKAVRLPISRALDQLYDEAQKLVREALQTDSAEPADRSQPKPSPSAPTPTVPAQTAPQPTAAKTSATGLRPLGKPAAMS